MKVDNFLKKFIKDQVRFLFFKNEFLSLLGSRYERLLILTSILALSYLAIGFAIGGLKELKTRMDNPYTNWVDLNIRSEYESKLPEMYEKFDDKTVLTKYQLKDLSGYCIYHPKFMNAELKGDLFVTKGRSIDFNSDLFRRILGSKHNNVISGLELTDKDTVVVEHCGLIVTKKLVDNLGYESKNPKNILLKSGGYFFLLPVVSVVKELPNYCDFLSSHSLYNFLQGSYSKTDFFSPEDVSNYFTFYTKNSDVEFIRKILSKEFPDKDIVEIKVESIDLFKSSTIQKYEIIYNVSDFPNQEERSKFFERNPDLFPHVEWTCSDKFNDIEHPHYIAFNFNNLDQVKPFSKYLNDQYEFQISLDQIESKDNFAKVVNLTLSLSGMMLLFCVLSLVFYLNSIVISHLERMKPNIGTFIAFGLKQKYIIQNYLLIVVVLLVLSSFLAFLLCLFIVFMIWLLKFKISIALFTIYLPILILITICIISYIAYRRIKKIVNNTPGDLVFER